ncbi:VOC family protein [Streptomyces sp. NPDC058045]|uniref:VOC family protein n=1 Tax=Streptomyces sp. NPDC058045 TaxID=3346311 RepID=UPI0036EB4E9E
MAATGAPGGPGGPPRPGAPAEGVPCWVDVQLPDIAAGRRFYGDLFGWTFHPSPAADPARLVQAYSGSPAGPVGRLVAALAAKPDGRLPTVWTVHLATPDAAATARRIQAAGGTVISTPAPLGTLGTAALAADPEGAVFGLWQPGDSPGFELRDAPGSFTWTEVHSRDRNTVDPFYARVFGYGAHDLPPGSEAWPTQAARPAQQTADEAELEDWESEGGAAEEPPPAVPGRRLWSPAGAPPGPATAVAGRSLGPGAFPAEMPPHFLVHFAVADCDTAAARVTALGGRVQAPPADTPYGRTAVVVDNQGAAFALRSRANG